MDRQEKEQWIDKLLVYANDEINQTDRGIKVVFFDFSEKGGDRISFLKNTSISQNDMNSILNISVNQNYFEYISVSDQYRNLRLTEIGQGRAISSELKIGRDIQTTPNIHIGTLNANGNTQIGNHNTQNIEIVFKELVEKIDNADAPEEQKQEAKSRLQKFLEHPLIGTALGLGGSALMASLGLRG